MVWKPEHEIVVQLLPEERRLFADRDSSCVLSEFQLRERKGINRSGEFPVAAIRRLYDAFGYETWFSGQSKLGEDTYLLTRMPGRRRAGDAAFRRIVDVFGSNAIEALNSAAAIERDGSGHTGAGGDPDLFVFNRRDPSRHFFVEVKLENHARLPVYRDKLGRQQELLFPLIARYLKCGVRLARVQLVTAG
jgi:hypothetical protein